MPRWWCRTWTWNRKMWASLARRSQSEFPVEVHYLLHLCSSNVALPLSLSFLFVSGELDNHLKKKNTLQAYICCGIWKWMHLSTEKTDLHSHIQEPLTSHLNFHCNCNQWFPSNIIYCHSILMGSAVKEIGMKPACKHKQRQEKICGEEEADFAEHTITGFCKNRGYGLIRCSKVQLLCNYSRVPLIQLWPSWSLSLQIFWSPMEMGQWGSPSVPFNELLCSRLSDSEKGKREIVCLGSATVEKLIHKWQTQIRRWGHWMFTSNSHELCSLPRGLTSCDMGCVTTSNRNERNLKTKTHGNTIVPDNIQRVPSFKFS